MSRIRYLVMLSEEPAYLAGFYARNFGLSELGRSAEGGVSLTDGSFNFTFLRPRPQLREPHMAIGLHHLGIAVDDIDAVVARYRATPMSSCSQPRLLRPKRSMMRAGAKPSWPRRASVRS